MRHAVAQACVGLGMLGVLLSGVGLRAAVAAGKMYWADAGAHKIQRANLDGSKVEDLISTGLGAPWGIALDVAGARCTGRTLAPTRFSGPIWMAAVSRT
jgi:hypothetical protein